MKHEPESTPFTHIDLQIATLIERLMSEGHNPFEVANHLHLAATLLRPADDEEDDGEDEEEGETEDEGARS